MTLYNNLFIDTNKPISEADIDYVEQQFGFKFPKEIRSHFLEYNGGCPEKYVFKKDDTFYVVQEFMTIKYGNPDTSFETTIDDLKIKRKILPEHLVPFAVDPGGDYYCFSVGKSDFGSIFIFRGEYSDDSNRSTRFLSPNIFQFIESMIEEE